MEREQGRKKTYRWAEVLLHIHDNKSGPELTLGSRRHGKRRVDSNSNA
jgi:hypothetical protein